MTRTFILVDLSLVAKNKYVLCAVYQCQSTMTMKHPLVLFSAVVVTTTAASASAAFVPPKRNAHGCPCRAAKDNNNEGGQNDIFDMVNNFWEAKKKDVGFPNVKLPSMPNPLDGFLKKGREAATTIEGVEDFDLDLANEIEAALAMANNEVEKQQPRQPARNDAASNMNSNRSIESATAAATKAWLDGMTSENTLFDDMSSSSSSSSSHRRKSEYSNETTNEHEQNNLNLFFATNNAEQYTKNENYEDKYFRGSSWSAESDNNVDNNRVKWSAESNNDSYNNNFSTAAQSFADEPIRAGQEKKSVEETYKMYKQYFEQGVDTSFNARRNDVEVPLQNDDSESTYVTDEEEDDVIFNEDDDGTKVYISDAAFKLSRSLNLDPYEIYQHIQNSSDGNVMVEEQDVRNYLDWRYNALLSKTTNLPKPKKQQPKRPQRVDQRTYRGNNGYSLPVNDLEIESGDNWQSYYDTYRRMAEPTAPSIGHRASSRQSPNRQRRDESRQVSSVQPRPEDRRSFPETNFPQYLTSHLPQRPRESQLSKLIFETKTEKFSNSHMRSTTDAVPFEQVNQANFYPRERHEDSRRKHEFHRKTSRGLGINKNYPQDRSYRDTKNKNSIDMVSRGNDDNMTYEQYNAYFAPNFAQTKRPTPVMPTSSGNSLKGLLENRLDRNLHKQELYNHQQYLDERLQRDMQRVSRLTNVQDQQRALESRLEYNTRQREMQELDQRLEQNIRRLSKTTQRVSRDAQRAIEGVQREWFSNRNEDQNKFAP